MRLLIAEDDTLFRMLLREALSTDYELEMVENGDAAWSVLQRADAPSLVLLDWVMSGLTGPQVCRHVRASAKSPRPYLLLFTSRNSVAEISAGVQAGADDYITKPFNSVELCARLQVGRRVVDLQNALESQIATTHNALALHDLVREIASPCSRCQKKRIDPELLRHFKALLQAQPNLAEGQSLCPECASTQVGCGSGPEANLLTRAAHASTR